MSEPQRVYFAGSLFNHKDLVGNLLLAAAIEKQSGHGYKCEIRKKVFLSLGASRRAVILGKSYNSR